ncbi:PD-(D/E)XK nuclease family protein [Arthrobacter koreensis]|uniref:PD-(D/E)XK nuclease family protein n=1 Tax=Arthrobacter koreensis TaxID=199136 RepID=UPI003D8E4853
MSTATDPDVRPGTRNFGRMADLLKALADTVAAAQESGPLQPVTVIAPSHSAALDVAHYLGRVGNGGRGSAGVRVLTLRDLADELAAARGPLARRSPLPGVVREGAISAVLAESPGLFSEVAGQSATARAVAETSAVLDSVCPADIDRLPPLAEEVARIHRKAAAALTSRWFTDHDLFTAAAAALNSPQILKRLGTVLAFQPAADRDPSATAFRTSLVQHAGLIQFTAAAPPLPGQIVLSASDADDEARAVVRLVADRLAAGVPGHRIGVFYSAADPYRALLVQRLNEAGIEFVGTGSHGLVDTSLGRGVTRLLSLDPAAPDLRIILDVMAQGSLHWQNGSLPSSAACERLHAHPPVETEENDDDSDAELSGYEMQRQQDYATFMEFAAVLGERLSEVFSAAGWADAADALTRFIDEFFAPRSAAERPEVAKAREDLLQVIRELELLQGIAPPPTPAAVRSTMERGISSHHFWHGSSGAGVVLGSYDDGVGRDLDVSFIMGAADGLAPARIRENPLLPDSIGELLEAPLPSIHERAAALKEQFRRLLATGTERTVLFPRGSLRSGGTYSPSRWLDGAEPSHLPSFAHGLTQGAPTGRPATAQEWRVRTLLACGAVDDAVLKSSLEARSHRRNGTFSRFNGDLSEVAGQVVDPQKPISPTHLEDWVISPLTYFLRRVLRAELFEDVTLEVQISKMQRGNLMHQVLEDYVRGLTLGTHPVSSERLLELAEEAFAATANPAWLKHTWERDQSRIRADLLKSHETDDRERGNGWQHVAVEAEFGGSAGDPPVELKLSDGSTVLFRGKVDRVDRHSDGRVRVIDYKSGKSEKYKDLSPDNPTAGGTRFQLPVYGLFARRFQQDTGVEVLAEYRFLSSTEKKPSVGYAVGPDVVATLREDIGIIMHAMRAGIFPPRPESDRYTNHTTLMGAAGVRHIWEQLKSDPALSDYSRFFQEEK